MTYRNISRPAGAANWTKTSQWVNWANDEGLAPSVAPVLDPTCAFCYGAVGTRFDGETFSICQQCPPYRGLITAVVPAVYSVDSGLESLLHRYKDFGIQYRWMSAPIGSLAFDFLARHLTCIEERYGEIDIFSVAPQGNSGRGFDHLGKVLSTVSGWLMDWDAELLVKVRQKQDIRGTIDRSCYELNDGKSVAKKNVLLFDDTWTSGSTLASAAATLKRNGARSVVAVTVGRQVSDWGTGPEIKEAIRDRRYDPERCVICG
ncbi:putative amidophosphoribosyltransferase [Mycobacterium tuberculosis]|nr:putative amidophosphoribosyltransferase [Mycobacterium tuberculosis]